MTDKLLINQDDALTDIVLNRPEVGNLIDSEMGLQLTDLFRKIGCEKKLIRISGAGADFCRGRETPPFDRTKAKAREFRDRVADPALALYNAVREAPAPTLGVIRGQASGVGCALAALCDLSIAAEDAVFRVPEMDQSIPPTLVISALIGRLPQTAISYLVLSREGVSAAQANAWGLVSKVVPAAALDDETARLTEKILSGPADALQAVKEYMRALTHAQSASATSLAANLIATVLSSR